MVIRSLLMFQFCVLGPNHMVGSTNMNEPCSFWCHSSCSKKGLKNYEHFSELYPCYLSSNKNHMDHNLQCKCMNFMY